MTRTLVQIRRQIEGLEREAEAIRDKEIAGVVARIKEAIAFYGLSTDDLFGGNAKKVKRRAVGASASAKKLATKKVSVAKFRDEATGKTWTGHGKRPGWFVDAIASGKSPEDLAVKP